MKSKFGSENIADVVKTLEDILNPSGFGYAGLTKRETDNLRELIAYLRDHFPRKGAFYVQMPIGDWSGDGHEQCEYFICECAKPVESVREAHFWIQEAIRIDITAICNRDQENEMDQEMEKTLNLLGFTFKDPIRDNDGRVEVWPEDMADLWAFLLNKADPELELRIRNKIFFDDLSKIPLIPFYGFDEQGRHIGGVGYGCF